MADDERRAAEDPEVLDAIVMPLDGVSDEEREKGAPAPTGGHRPEGGSPSGGIVDDGDGEEDELSAEAEHGRSRDWRGPVALGVLVLFVATGLLGIFASRPAGPRPIRDPRGARRKALELVKQSDDPTLGELVLRGLELENPEDAKGHTLFHLMVRQGLRESVAAALARNPRLVALRDGEGETPFFDAMLEGRLEIGDMLLEAGAEIGASDRNGNTALHQAAYRGKFETARYLVARGIAVDAKDSGGHTALNDAARKGRLEIVRFLLDHRADANAVNPRGYTVLHRTAYEGHGAIVKELLGRGAACDLADEDGDRPLHEAARNGKGETVKILLEAGASASRPNGKGITPLHRACQTGDLAMVRLLLDAGAAEDAVEEEGAGVLHFAARAKTDEVMRFWLARGGHDPNRRTVKGRSPLMRAVWYERLAPARALVEAGAALDLTDTWGATALHDACSKKSLPLVKLLVEAGARRDVKTAKGNTPLDLAGAEEALDVLVYLRGKGLR